jgi:HSP20 family protein
MLLRTDPFRELDRLSPQLRGTPGRPAPVPMDACRVGDELIVQFDLPGVDATTIDLTVEKNVLTVHATRRPVADERTEMVVSERLHGTFARRLFLGDTLDQDRLQASYADGVLEVRIPISERAKPRRIAVEHRGRADTRRAGADDLVAVGASN